MWVDYCSYIYIVILNNYLFIGVVQCMPRIESISTSSGVGGKEGLPISDTIILESLHCYLYLAVDNHATKILTTILCTAQQQQQQHREVVDPICCVVSDMNSKLHIKRLYRFYAYLISSLYCYSSSGGIFLPEGDVMAGSTYIFIMPINFILLFERFNKP